MAVSHPLPDDLVELIAERFHVLAEPTRIKLLDRLREADGWCALTAPIGSFDAAAIRAACRAMAGEGLVEVDPSDPLRARLPLA